MEKGYSEFQFPRVLVVRIGPLNLAAVSSVIRREAVLPQKVRICGYPGR